MKFLVMVMFDAAKTAEVAEADDKASSTPGINVLASYVCLGAPFPGVPPNTIVSFSICDDETAEAIAAVTYPLMQAGATVYRVPILDLPRGGAAEQEKQYRG